MLKRIPMYKQEESNIENHRLAEWVFNSHNWYETVSGYFICKWCRRQHTNSEGINLNFPLCIKNPILKKVLL